MNSVARHRVASWSVLVALLLSLLPVAALQPAVAQAEGRKLDQVDQTSANPNQEIVYIDSNGFVRVLDVEPSGTAKTIQFISPEGGWRNLALGDFNNDGDMEIVVVKGSGPSTSVLTIYDPVVSAGATVPGQEINGVPWKQLATFALPDRPETVAAGNFDPNVSGDEFMVVRESVPGEAQNDNDWRAVVYKQTTATNGDGTRWQEHTARNFGKQWDRVGVANVNGQGGDEALFIESGVAIEAYQVDQNWRRIFEYGSDCRVVRDAAFGQFLGGGTLELIMVARQRCSQSSIQDAFRVYSYQNDVFPETWSFGLRFDPEPRTVFVGDINGNGDDEAIMLRVIEGSAEAARLIVRGSGDDQIISDFQNGLPLASDNGYREGAAGDIDGDGRDEIVIIRDNNIRYYPDANTSAQAVDFSTSTNRRSIAIGDLDAQGSTSGPTFVADVAKIEITANFGFATNTGQFTLKNGSTEEGLPFTVATDQSVLSVNPPTGTAPGKSSGGIVLTYNVDARNLVIGQTIMANIRVFSNGTPQALNSPLVIPVTIKVQAPPFEAIPAGASAMFIPCNASAAPTSVTLTVSGLPGSQFVDAQVWGTTRPPAMASAAEVDAAAAVASFDGDLFLGRRSEDGSSFILRNAAGEEQVVPASAGAAPLSVASAAAMDAAEIADSIAAIQAVSAITFTSHVSWVTSISADRLTLPAQLTLTIDPAQRSGAFQVAGLILVGPSYDVANPIAARSYPVTLVCTDFGTWMPIMRK
jgi:hypothetical protein